MISIRQKMRQIGPITPQRVAQNLGWRWKDLQPMLRAAATWRGERPRVYVHNVHPHPIFKTYVTHPPLRYAPYPFAELCHWVNLLPNHHLLHKPHIFEIEHFLLFLSDRHHFMRDWYRVYSENEVINQVVARDQCRRVFTFSSGLAEHCKQFLHPDLWPKLDYVYPAYPFQPEYERPAGAPFTILVIASRFSDKGVPEALQAYQILRARHGSRVRLLLVSQDVPTGYHLPDGVIHYGQFASHLPFMSAALKQELYQAADVLLLPCYSETAACFTEACAYGVPIITTRIHHGDEFVRDGSTGFLLDAPVFIYSPDYARRWRTAEEFLDELAAMRERGELDVVVEQAVERLEAMISGQVDVATMRQAARRLHAERFSPPVRNQKLLHLYAAALPA